MIEEGAFAPAGKSAYASQKALQVQRWRFQVQLLQPLLQAAAAGMFADHQVALQADLGRIKAFII